MAEQSWKFSLDIKEFTENALKAKGTIEKLGDAENLAGLTEGLLKTTTALGVVAAAAFAFKKALDFVEEAEAIQKINNQFEILTKNAGLSGAAIKEGLVGAAGGLADDTEILKAANEEVVRLGTNSQKLPQIMDLARKATAVMGGDMVERFKEISNAVAAGNQKQLKNMGIIVDVQKSYKDYAKTIGQTIDSLSEEQKQHALLGAVLKQGEQQFKGIADGTGSATLGMKKLGVTLNELKELFVLAFDRTIGPTIRRMVDNMNVLATATTSWFKDHFGTDSDQAAAKAAKLAEQINVISNKINEAKADRVEGGFWNNLWYGKDGPDKAIADLEKQREALRATRAELLGKVEKPPEEGQAEVAPKKDNSLILAERTKLEQDLLTMRQKRLDDESKTAQVHVTEDGQMEYDSDQAIQEKIANLNTEAMVKKQALIDKYGENNAIVNQQIEEIEKDRAAKAIALEDEVKTAREKSLQNWVNHSQTASQGVDRAFRKGTEDNKRALTDWGKTGDMVYNSFKGHALSAFKGVAAGTQTASQAMKGMVFGTVADTAEAKGSEMILAGIWPPNPPAIAGGLALLALSSKLSSMAGGASAGGGSVGGGGGAGGGGGSVSSSSTEVPGTPQLQEAPKKTVTFTVQGHMFNTEQTQKHIVDMIKQESDATDFRFRQVGQ